jgi:hypothetical protein
MMIDVTVVFALMCLCLGFELNVYPLEKARHGGTLAESKA